MSGGVYEDFQKFMYTNDVVVAAAGISIGTITKEFITAVLEQVVLPITSAVGDLKFVREIRKKIYAATHKKFMAAFSDKVTDLIWLMFVWLATIILTFMILEYLLNMTIIRMRTHMSPEDERQFREAKDLISGKNDDDEKEKKVQPYDASGQEGQQNKMLRGAKL